MGTLAMVIEIYVMPVNRNCLLLAYY